MTLQTITTNFIARIDREVKAARGGLTKEQSKILTLICSRLSETGKAPTFMEILNHFNFKSPNSVSEHLRHLEKKKCITRNPGVARSLRVTDKGNRLFVQIGELS